MTEPSVRFKVLYLIILFILLISNISVPQIYPDKQVHRLLKSGIKLIIDQEYGEARKSFHHLDITRRDLPLGKIYLAAVEIAEAYDYQKPFNDKLINQYLDGAEKIADRLMEEDDKNIWNLYCMALLKGYSAYYEALKGDWFDALATGLSSVSFFEDCLKMDNDFYESFIAVGTYKFWRSKKTDFINWLPFIPDEKEAGIENLKIAVKYSDYNSHLAINSLIWIYIEQEDFREAADLSQNALKKHPHSRIFKWGLARAYEEIDPAESVLLYKEILNSYPAAMKTNKVNEVTLKHLIAQQLLKIQRSDEALRYCDEILEISSFSEYENEKLGNRLERVRKLKKAISRK